MAEQTNKKIMGQNLRVFLGDKAVAYATNCVATVNQNLEDASTKDSTGGFDEQELVGLSWNLSVDALFSVGANDQMANSGGQMLDLVLAGQKVNISFDVTSGEKNRVRDTSFSYRGMAWPNQITLNAPNKQKANYSASFTGDGPLAKATSAGS